MIGYWAVDGKARCHREAVDIPESGGYYGVGSKLGGMKPNALPLVAYLVCVVWAVAESSKRWMTLLQIAVSLVSVLLLAYLLSLAAPGYTLAIADLAGLIAMLVSAVVGWNYVKRHRRSRPPRT
jgi:hypothetical protein